MWQRSRHVYENYRRLDRPLAKFVNGNVETSVWRNRENDGPLYKLSFNRLEDGRRVKSFHAADTFDFLRGSNQATKWMRQQVKRR